MEQIPLYTRDGAYVCDVYVPPFTPPAEMLVWGQRYFARRADGKYYEGLAYWCGSTLRPVRAEAGGHES